MLAELARGRLGNKLPQLRQALRGRFGDHHALLVGLALGHLEQLEASIAELDAHIDRVLAPFARARDQLDTITGVGKRAAETIIAEIGVDMGVLPTAAHLASWAGRCPGNNRTGGKRRSGKTTKGNRWLGEMLTECAWAAARSRDSYLSAQFWRLARRIGKQKAAMAVGHSILVIAWQLLTNDCDDADLGGDYFLRRDAERARQRAVAQLQALGYQVTLQPLAARRGFSFQDEIPGSSPASRTTLRLTCGDTHPCSLSIAAAPVSRLDTAVSERIPGPLWPIRWTLRGTLASSTTRRRHAARPIRRIRALGSAVGARYGRTTAAWASPGRRPPGRRGTSRSRRWQRCQSSPSTSSSEAASSR